MKKGKFIVIDGTDGSGKATQTKLLCEAIEKEKIKVKKIDLPQYSNNFFGKLLRECLDGKLGDFIAVNPKIASVLYAADRWESSDNIQKWLEQGYIVIADRYVSSNQIHQGGKIFDNEKRKEFLEWLNEMEFNVFKISKPDAIIFLDVPIEVTRGLLLKRAAEKAKVNPYKTYKDLAEENEGHLRESHESALKMVKSNNNWVKVDCTKDDKLMSIDEIHKRIWSVFNKIIK
jgi:dTMP kinase